MSGIEFILFTIGFIVVVSVVGGLIWSMVSNFKSRFNSETNTNTSRTDRVEKETKSATIIKKSSSEMDEFYAERFHKQAWECIQKKQYRDAITKYDLAIKYMPVGTYFNNRGLAKEQLNDLHGAIEDYGMAINISPMQSLFWFNRGMVYHNSGNLKLAYPDLSKASSLGSVTAKEILDLHYVKFKDLGLTPNSKSKTINEVQVINDKDLLGTRWHLIYEGTDTKNQIIEFCPNGKLINSRYPNEISRWSSVNEIITLEMNDGYTLWQTVKNKGVMIGEGCNFPVGDSYNWHFRLEEVNNFSQPSTNISFKSKQFTFTKYNITHLYHITHISNLQNILQNGLLSHNQAHEGYIKTNIADNEVNKRRQKKEPIFNRSLHDYVPLYFNPKNPMLFRRQNLQNEIVLLAIEKNVLFGMNSIYSDGNAAANSTHFFKGINDLAKINWDCIHADHWSSFPDGKRIRCAEVMVYQKIDVSRIRKVICYNKIHPFVLSQVRDHGFLEAEINNNFFF